MFFDSAAEDKINVNTLAEIVTSKQDEFKNIFVRRFTHVKNMGSPVLHEYLHVILEDNSTDKWTRVIAERQAGPLKLRGWEANDQVIVRRWPAGEGYENHAHLEPDYFPFKATMSSSSSSSGPNGRDLPLPLVTRSYEKGKFSLKLLAELLLECHKLKPHYNPYSFNCYWFAANVFESHRPVLGDFVDNRWKYAHWKGCKSKIGSLERWSKALKAAMNSFKIILPGLPIDAPGGGYSEDLAVSQTEQDKYFGTFMDILTKELSEELGEITKDEKEQMEANIADYHASIDECIDAETRRDDFERNLEFGKDIAYRQGWNPQVKSVPDEVLVAPTEDQLSHLERALFAFLGRLSEKEFED